MADVTINQLPTKASVLSTDLLPITDSGGTVTSKASVSQISVPAGGIILWSGMVVPSGWRLCDGTNGTPDLRNRFVVGSGSSYALNTTGGSASSSVTTSGSIDTINISAASTAGHSHRFSCCCVRGGCPSTDGGQSPGITSSRINNNTVTSTGTASTISPYYALAYIQKIA